MGSRFRGNDDWGAAPTQVCRGGRDPAQPPLGSRFRGNDDWGAAPTQVRRGRGGTPPSRPSGYRPRIGVRGRLFAGMTDGEPPLRGSVGDGEGPRPAAPLGSRLRGNDDWGAAPTWDRQGLGGTPPRGSHPHLSPLPSRERRGSTLASVLSRLGRGGGVFQRFQDNLGYRFRLAQHFIVPEPQETKPLGLQPICAILVVDSLALVMPAVQFDYQPTFQAHEIHDVRTQGHLPPKLVISQLPAAKVLPQSQLGLGRVSSELPSPGDGVHPPHLCAPVEEGSHPHPVSSTGQALSPLPSRERRGEGMVGVTGLEPATPCTPCRCAPKLRHTPTYG